MHFHIQAAKPNMTREQKEAQALRFTFQEWLTDEQIVVLRGWAMQPHKSTPKMYRQLRMMLSFAGVQGYWPVRAVMRWMLKLRREHLNK